MQWLCAEIAKARHVPPRVASGDRRGKKASLFGESLMVCRTSYHPVGFNSTVLLSLHTWRAHHDSLHAASSRYALRCAYRRLPPHRPLHRPHGNNQKRQRNPNACPRIHIRMPSPQPVHLSHPRANCSHTPTEAIHDPLQDLTTDSPSPNVAIRLRQRRTLQIVRHAQDGGAKDVDGECAERK